jgi:hypothetical protein
MNPQASLHLPLLHTLVEERAGVRAGVRGSEYVAVSRCTRDKGIVFRGGFQRGAFRKYADAFGPKRKQTSTTKNTTCTIISRIECVALWTT